MLCDQCYIVTCEIKENSLRSLSDWLYTMTQDVDV